MSLVTVFGILIIAAILAVILGQYKSEYALAVAITAGTIVFLGCISSVLEPMFRLCELILEAGIKTSYFSVAFKTLGICLVTGFVADICRDFGQTALAGFALTAGKCAIFVISVPILSELLSAAYSFINR